ncbi:hypothetical protein BT96DRAFT_976727 [Gymnopus androsaceus JB14]|uniref:Uncharacterized protein n=1 Tax=Gymnopus androsaceus JB14 TaxID=1447944 RepID=A0A6A4HGR4_9AGAR|nr:hypothetical protein BT96DRAFT_976727 [Gymnopus androsaceus JB14]
MSSTSTNDSDLATDADWEKFWAAAKKINAPLTFLVEPTLTIEPDSRVAEKLWNFFSGFDDKAGRERWTQDLMIESRAQDPRWNYVVCYSRHSINFEGRQGIDWDVRTYNYKLKIGSASYQVYAFRAGIFSLIGDGGFLNWAFIGRVLQRDPDSRRPRNIVFGNP